MTDKKYKVIVSDRAKRMLGAHIRFIAQVNKDAASTKKKEIIAAIRSLNHMPQRFPFFEEACILPNRVQHFRAAFTKTHGLATATLHLTHEENPYPYKE